jgi:hypothetical protein
MTTTGTGQAFTALIHRALRGYQSTDELARIAALADLPGWQGRRRGLPAAEVGPAFRALLDARIARLAGEAPRRPICCSGASSGLQRLLKSRALNYSERSVYTRQEEALTELAQIIWDMDAAAQVAPALTAADLQPALRRRRAAGPFEGASARSPVVLADLPGRHRREAIRCLAQHGNVPAEAAARQRLAELRRRAAGG